MKHCIFFIIRLFAVAVCMCTTIQADNVPKTSSSSEKASKTMAPRDKLFPTSSSVHSSTVGQTNIGRTLTTAPSNTTTTRVKIIGAGIIAFFSVMLLLIFPLFCYSMKHQRKNSLDAETGSTRAPEVELQTTTNGQILDDTTIANVVGITGYTPLGITDAYLNRSVTFTMRDRITLHNISRQLQIIIDKTGTGMPPDADVVKVKAIQEASTDDEESASGQSTQLKTLEETSSIDQPSCITVASISQASVCVRPRSRGTAGKAPCKNDIQHRKRLSLPRFDETSPNFYHDIAGFYRITSINDNCEYLEPMPEALPQQPTVSTSPDVPPVPVRRQGLPRRSASFRKNTSWIKTDPEN